MAILDITEYTDASHGNPIEPPVCHQVLELADEPVQSKPFHKSTRVVHVVSDVNCLIGIGKEPIAERFLAAGQPQTRTIYPGENHMIAAIPASQETASEASRVNSLIQLITNPAAAAERLAELETQRMLIKARSEQVKKNLKKLAEKQAATEAAAALLQTMSDDFKAHFEATDKSLSEREAVLTATQKDFDERAAEEATVLRRREEDVTKRENTLVERARALSENEKTIAATLTDLERRRALIRQATE